jgi:hypothetical protein
MGDRVVARGLRETRPTDGGVRSSTAAERRLGWGGGRPGRAEESTASGRWASRPRAWEVDGRCRWVALIMAEDGRAVLVAGRGSGQPSSSLHGRGGGQTALCRQRVFRFESVGVRGSRDGHARGTKCPNFHRPPLADRK